MHTTKFFDPVVETLVVRELRPVEGAPGLVTLITPSGLVNSCQPDGTIVEKADNFDGGFERAQDAGNLATWQPEGGRFYTRAFVMVDKL